MSLETFEGNCWGRDRVDRPAKLLVRKGCVANWHLADMSGRACDVRS